MAQVGSAQTTDSRLMDIDAVPNRCSPLGILLRKSGAVDLADVLAPPPDRHPMNAKGRNSVKPSSIMKMPAMASPKLITSSHNWLVIRQTEASTMAI